jgi:hypothetical protein
VFPDDKAIDLIRVEISSLPIISVIDIVDFFEVALDECDYLLALFLSDTLKASL